jgi:copper(I)-binding protein
MRMRPIAGLDVKPAGRVVLQPGGYHVMLVDLKHPLQAGEHFPLTLEFEKAGSIEVDVEVESMAAGAMHPNAVR